MTPDRSRPAASRSDTARPKRSTASTWSPTAGQVVAVLGPNGAGKTTFVRMVATLLSADEGTLLVAGHDVRREPAAVRRMIGLAGQFAADRAGDDRAREPRDGRPPVRPEPPGGEGERRRRCSSSSGSSTTPTGSSRTYSGGMRRRLDLGASLVGAPRLLLLDEPTTGLDPRSRIELWDAIRALVAAGTDVLLTTQYLDEADHLASQVVIIDHGRAVAAGHAGRAQAPDRRQRRRAPRPPPTGPRRVAELLARPGHGEAQIDEPTRRVSVRVDVGARRADGRAAARSRTRASSSTTSRCASRTSTRCSSPSPAGRPATKARCAARRRLTRKPKGHDQHRSSLTRGTAGAGRRDRQEHR